MDQNDDWKEITSTAVGSLSSTFLIATATGFPDIARSSSMAQIIILNDFWTVESPEQVPEESIEYLSAKAAQLEQQIEQAGIPKTAAFKCKANFEDCLNNAGSKGQKAHCLAVYLVCLGQSFVPLMG